MSITEGIIIAALGLVASILGSVITARRDAKKTAANMYAQLCQDQQKRIEQLQARLDKNEQELERMQAELATMREENTKLRNRVRALEDERAELLAEIAELKQQRCGG